MRNCAKNARKVYALRYERPSVFRDKVLAVVKKIRIGETITYSMVAKRAGNAKAYRAVGNILNKNYDPSIPCHRVIRKDGTFGGYNRGVENKKKILKQESS
jgi:O-6-methylguanine DNA methyltransferase